MSHYRMVQNESLPKKAQVEEDINIDTNVASLIYKEIILEKERMREQMKAGGGEGYSYFSGSCHGLQIASYVAQKYLKEEDNSDKGILFTKVSREKFKKSYPELDKSE